MPRGDLVEPLDPEGRQALADALGDTPLTVIPVHDLRRGRCSAWAVGEPARARGAVVQGVDVPAEPAAFGTDAEAVWRILQSVRGWTCVNCGTDVAPALRRLLARAMGVPVRAYGDLYYVLARPAAELSHPAVRLLGAGDAALLEGAPPAFRAPGFAEPRELLREGVVACGIVGGEMVAMAHTSAVTERHADIGVFTLPQWRRRGLASAAASRVARRVQEQGRRPTWSTGEDNAASRRVAEKLGFERAGQRVYLIPQQ